MVTAAQKFTEYFEDMLSERGTNEQAFLLACEHWKERHGFEPPYSSYDSFRKMFSYYYKKKQIV